MKRFNNGQSWKLFLTRKTQMFCEGSEGGSIFRGGYHKKKKRFNDPAPLFSSKMGQRRRVVKKSPLFSFFLGPFGPPAFPHMLLWWLPLMEKQEREFVDQLFLSFSFIQFFSFTFSWAEQVYCAWWRGEISPPKDAIIFSFVDASLAYSFPR